MTKRAGIAAVEKLGACLVFPLDNQPEPVSLWSHFFPKSRMRWEWDSGGDNRVAELWHLREELSRSGRVAYAKWYKNRATFFSLDVFSALARVCGAIDEDAGLGEEALALYRCYEETSPLSTKEVKVAAEMQGRFFERAYERGMKELWARLLIVGWGEKDDGAFPSLRVGATKWMHEEAWKRAGAMTEREAKQILDEFLPEGSPFRRELHRILGKRAGVTVR